MPGLLLDTSIIIDHLRGRDSVIIDKCKREGPIFISSITDFEVWRGVRAGEEDVVAILLKSIASLDITKTIAEEAAKIYSIQLKDKLLGFADCIILATLKGHNLRLASRDKNLLKASHAIQR